MVSDKEMLDRIAKLSTAIQQHKRGGGSGGGGYTGRGRGAPNVTNYHQTYRPSNRTLNTTTPPLSQHRTLNNNKTSNNSPLSQHRILTNNTKPPVLGQYRPVNNITSQHRTLNNTATSSKPTTPVISQHRTLVNNAATPSTSMKPFTTKTIPPKPVSTSSHNRTLVLNPKGPHQVIKSMDNGKKKVSINGVEFIVKGKKLIRQDLLDKSAPIQSTAPKVLIRKSIKRHKSHNLTTAPNKISKVASAGKFKKGNLVYYPHSKGYVRTGRSGKSITLKPTKTKHCGFFTRYGKCPKADIGRCLFKHDRERRAICMRFLSGKCKRSAAECRLSHSPNPHILPHCAHFQKGNCNNPNCPYAHVGVSPDAPVCRAFAMEGYCPKGIACRQKHVHLCPEFAETSKCSNINCRLPHVARKTTDTNTTGIVKLGSWVSPKYFYEQKMAKEERMKANLSKVWSRPQTASETSAGSNKEAKHEEKPIDREQEEEQGFVRLFDDSDEDEGWSQFEREDTVDNSQSLRFNDDDNEEEEEEEEEEEDAENIEEKGEDGGDDEPMEDEEMDENSDGEEVEFYDAKEDAKEVIVLSDDDSDMEVYEEISDDDITEEDLS